MIDTERPSARLVSAERRPAWLGLDVGTQGARAVIYADDGRRLGEGRADRPPRRPEAGAMVHRPETDWWEGSVEAIAAAVRQAGPRTRVAGVGLSGLFPAVALLDHEGRPVGDAILYGDGRVAQEVAFVADRLGRSLTGDEVAPRLIWLRRRRPRDWRRAQRVAGPSGYVGLRLTGELAIDPHAAARWGGLADDARTGWAPDALAALDLPNRLFPPIRRPLDPLGTVTAAAAAATGLAAGTPVVVGTTDSVAELLGSGLTQPGDAMVYYGSSGTLLVVTTPFERAIRDPAQFGVASPYRLAAYAVDSGRLLERARAEWFGGRPFAELDAAAAAVAPGAGGVVVVPHVSGRLLPTPRPAARGAIVGLELGHGSAHIWRALLESFGFVLRRARDQLTDPVGRVAAGGGGSRSETWRGIVSDVTGWTQFLPPSGGATRGAALIAACGLGRPDDLDALAGRWLAGATAGDGTTPRRRATQAYRAAYERWCRIETALTDEVT